MTLAEKNAVCARRPLPSATPTVFISYRIGDAPYAGLRHHPWEVADCECVLVNAYDFLANKRTRTARQEFLESGVPLREYLGYRGVLWMDSGAFNFISNPALGVRPEQVWEVGLQADVDAIVSLDHPFPPNTPREEVDRRVGVTIDNVGCMAALRHPDGPDLIPVLHGHDIETLHRCQKGFEAAMGTDLRILGLGSLALLAKTGAVRSLSQTIRLGREISGQAHLHIFSVGSPLLMHFAFLAGASSVDTQAWIMSAAFKQVFIPGNPQVRLAQRSIVEEGALFERKLRSASKALVDDQIEGLVVRDWDTGSALRLRDERDASEYLLDMVDVPGRSRVHHRACHNVQVMTSEARRFRESANKEAFVLSRMRKTPYIRAAEEILTQYPPIALSNSQVNGF